MQNYASFKQKSLGHIKSDVVTKPENTEPRFLTQKKPYDLQLGEAVATQGMKIVGKSSTTLQTCIDAPLTF